MRQVTGPHFFQQDHAEAPSAWLAESRPGPPAVQTCEGWKSDNRDPPGLSIKRERVKNSTCDVPTSQALGLLFSFFYFRLDSLFSAAFLA